MNEKGMLWRRELLREALTVEPVPREVKAFFDVACKDFANWLFAIEAARDISGLAIKDLRK